jgi:hypothetical protein
VPLVGRKSSALTQALGKFGKQLIYQLGPECWRRFLAASGPFDCGIPATGEREDAARGRKFWNR